jgi:hypothetical protein
MPRHRPHDPDNVEIARSLERVADLFELQGAPEPRVRAWRAGAAAVVASQRSVADVYRAEGLVGLDALPDIGRGLAWVIGEIVETGHTRVLDRLEGDVTAIDVLGDLPGMGPTLARRVHRELGVSTLEELLEAAREGRLAHIRGFGERRVRLVRALLAGRMSGRFREVAAPPAVDLLLSEDRRYREKAAAGELRRIAPRRMNPEGEAWLPILHEEREGWHFTVLFSNTPLAHQLGKTRDWVVIYYERDGVEGRATVVTETRGPMRGRRVVRGREGALPAVAAPREIVAAV